MKCIQYWPENSETNQFETVDVTHQETLEFEDHVERTFSLRHKKVIMAYFTAETAHSCLVSLDNLLTFRNTSSLEFRYFILDTVVICSVHVASCLTKLLAFSWGLGLWDTS